MTFDPTISLGSIISALAVLVTIIASVINITTKLAKLEWKMTMMWKWYSREHGIDERDG